MNFSKKKSDLSHWDFAEHFSGYDAAALILGIEPRESEDEQWRIRVVCDRMELHYEQARKFFFLEIVVPIALNYETRNYSDLLSVKMEDHYRKTCLMENGNIFSEWLEDDRQAKFDKQEFSRNEIVSWLKAIGMQSEYSFNRDCSDKVNLPENRWPWGNYHTEMLGNLEAAARRFWIGYDPLDTTTANTNATVSEWLQTERKVSKTMADSIATMLRPDGLPTGPRK